MQTETIQEEFERIIDQETWSYVDRYFNSPESEIYGRSLSTPRYLGVLMLREHPEEAIKSPEADQARVEFITSVEEGFGTDEELGGGLVVRDFDSRPVINGKVMAKDLKTAVSLMTEAGVRCAEETAKQDPQFLPQLVRSERDHENAIEVDNMVQDKTQYNTRIVVSPYPEEAAARTGDEYWRKKGYVPHLRRGFVQLYHVTGTEVTTGSLSFDGSDKKHLRKVFKRHGRDIPEEEITDNWLQYSITGSMSEQEAKELALAIANQADTFSNNKTRNTVDVTHEHRTMIDQVFDESYAPACESLARGCQTKETRELVLQFTSKAQSFNRNYETALYRMRSNPDRFTSDDFIVIHELLVYSTIEMMRALHMKEVQTQMPHTANLPIQLADASYMSPVGSAAFKSILSGFGAAGARSGRTYSACGLSISAGKDTLTKNGGFSDNPQSVFGGLDQEKFSKKSEDEDCEFVSEECPECGEKNVKTVVKKIKHGKNEGKKLITGDCGCSKVA